MSCSIKRPGLNFSEKSLLNDQVHLRKNWSSWFIYYWIFGKSLHFSNPRSLERPGLIIGDLRVTILKIARGSLTCFTWTIKLVHLLKAKWLVLIFKKFIKKNMPLCYYHIKESKSHGKLIQQFQLDKQCVVAKHILIFPKKLI